MDVSWMTEEQKILIEDKFAALLASKAKASPIHNFCELDYSPFEPLKIMDGSFRGMTYLHEWQARCNLGRDTLEAAPDFVFDTSPRGQLNWDQVAMFDLKTWRQHPQVVDRVYDRLYTDDEERNTINDYWLQEEFGGFGQRLAAQISIFKAEILNRYAKKKPDEPKSRLM